MSMARTFMWAITGEKMNKGGGEGAAAAARGGEGGGSTMWSC